MKIPIVLITTNSNDGPIPLNTSWCVRQLKGKWARIWIYVRVYSSDVNSIRLQCFTSCGFFRMYLGGIIIDVQQVDLKCASSTHRGYS